MDFTLHAKGFRYRRHLLLPEDVVRARLRPDVSPVSALLLTARLFFNYFSLEILFGVPEPFGKSANEVVKEIADIIRNGVCARQ